MARRISFLVVALLSLTGCASPEAEPAGEAVFRNPVADGNTFSCSTCHALEEPAEDGIRRPGHALGDVTRRPSYKNGAVGSLREAVNTCLVEWMAAESWEESDARWGALHGWLESLAPDAPAPAVAIQIVPPPAEATGGDPMAGHALFNRSCSGCHGTDGAGTVRGPRITGYDYAEDFVARRIRTSGLETSPVYDGLTGGRMPFWGADRLTDTEVRDLAAYVNASEPPAQGGGNGGGGGETRVCESTHPSIGRTATLATHAHGVRGTARIVDDCTIVFEDFSYDGGGIDVRVYGALGGNYDAGFAFSENLLGTPYASGTLTVHLPVDKTLDDLDGVSIWCVAASFSFGDGLFAP